MEKFAKSRGFTLVELLAGVAIIAILIAVAYPSYLNYVKRARIHAAYQALLDNAHALERHYANHANFKKNSTTWMDLAITQTQHFCIRFQGNPRGTTSDSIYSIKAVAWDKKQEPRVLLFNQNGTAQLCQSSSSTCEEQDFFKNPARADKNCQPYPS
ncbi:prepilin-type N-terminal cleavage/methylation domain-containing protein [Wielerella bovis]|uniref:type IV pilin protein n=1 Tax=Wielerella bovis TaxID=2917790 RepID=UPI002018B86C|nr:type IV pilin protein [Wielerella bovis]ULJ68423.1 prepilin-type N-terminal cleavage/methylation domain-containing protein [Wielerella bovis]